MKCQRCLSDQRAAYRAYTDALSIKVCATCAKEAVRLGIGVECLGAGKEKGEAQKVSLDYGIVGQNL